jgi:hypothetical protein
MIILDQKEMYQGNIEELTRYRRYSVPNQRKLKRIVEFSYPVDSVKHPLVQISDLVIYLVRKFLECEGGYRKDWQADARNFYASCYAKILARVHWSTLIEAAGAEEKGAHDVLTAAQATHRPQWRRYYKLPPTCANLMREILIRGGDDGSAGIFRCR